MTSHLFFSEVNKFDVKIDVILNGLEKYVTYFLNKNLVFIDSIQFKNSSLKKLVQNLWDDDFKYLTKELGSKNLEFLKQKAAYPYEYMKSLKDLAKTKYLINVFYSSVKDGTTGDNGEKLDCHMSDKDYLRCKKNWNEFKMENMGDYHYLKKKMFRYQPMFLKSLLILA